MIAKIIIPFLTLTVLVCAKGQDSLSWWGMFDEPSLDKIVENGLQNNRNLQAVRKRTEQTLEQAKLNRSLLFPSLYANGRWSGRDMNGSSQPNPESKDMMSTASVSLDARYSISSLGEELQQYKAIIRRYEAQVEEQKDAELSTSVQIAKLYFDAVHSKRKLQILNKQKETALQLLELTNTRYKKGESSGLALLQQKQQLASTEASIPPAELQLKSSIEYLASVTSFSRDSLQQLIPDTLPRIGENVASEVTIKARPDLAAASLMEESAKASFNKAKMTLIPDLSVTGSAGWDYSDPGTAEWEQLWSVGATVSMPIFTGGAVVAGYREGRAGYEAAVASREQAWDNAEMELQNALTEERSFRSQVEAYRIQLEASQALYNESLRMYRNGLVEYIEVLSSINALQQTEIVFLMSRRNLLHARLKVVDAVGGTFSGVNN